LPVFSELVFFWKEIVSWDFVGGGAYDTPQETIFLGRIHQVGNYNTNI